MRTADYETNDKPRAPERFHYFLRKVAVTISIMAALGTQKVTDPEPRLIFEFVY